VSQPQLSEQYPLEIIARARTVQSRCRSLLKNDFISDAPKVFAQTISNMCEHLQRAVPAIAFVNEFWPPNDAEIWPPLWVTRVV
jgi:hypothetical protein